MAMPTAVVAEFAWIYIYIFFNFAARVRNKTLHIIVIVDVERKSTRKTSQENPST